MRVMRRKNLRTTSEVQADYEQNAEEYDKARFGTIGGQYVNKVEQDFVSKFVKDPRVLEVGTATGRFAEVLTSKGAEYTGVDLSKKMLSVTYQRIKRVGNIVQMDGCQLGLRSFFNYVLCIRTFHFLPKPIDALQGMFAALEPSGECLVTFETDNLFRRLLLFFGIGTSQQYYYKISDVEDMFLEAGFRLVRSGSVMRLPVTLYRRCPKLLLPILKRIERLWPFPMHQYVLGSKNCNR